MGSDGNGAGGSVTSADTQYMEARPVALPSNLATLVIPIKVYRGRVRPDGGCEVKPDMRCVWVEAYERSLEMPRYGYELLRIQPPVNQRLQDTASWINMLHDIDGEMPDGWVNTLEIPVIPPEKDQKTRASWTLNSKQAAV